MSHAAPGVCPSCARARFPGEMVCSGCGYPFPVETRATPPSEPPTGWAARPAPQEPAKGFVRAIIFVLLVMIAIFVIGVAQQLS